MENSTSETRTIKTADGNRLEYQVIGAGRPIVFLHGFLANRFTFSRRYCDTMPKAIIDVLRRCWYWPDVQTPFSIK